MMQLSLNMRPSLLWVHAPLRVVYCSRQIRRLPHSYCLTALQVWDPGSMGTKACSFETLISANMPLPRTNPQRRRILVADKGKGR